MLKQGDAGDAIELQTNFSARDRTSAASSRTSAKTRSQRRSLAGGRSTPAEPNSSAICVAWPRNRAGALGLSAPAGTAVLGPYRDTLPAGALRTPRTRLSVKPRTAYTDLVGAVPRPRPSQPLDLPPRPRSLKQSADRGPSGGLSPPNYGIDIGRWSGSPSTPRPSRLAHVSTSPP